MESSSLTCWCQEGPIVPGILMSRAPERSLCETPAGQNTASGKSGRTRTVQSWVCLCILVSLRGFCRGRLMYAAKSRVQENSHRIQTRWANYGLGHFLCAFQDDCTYLIKLPSVFCLAQMVMEEEGYWSGVWGIGRVDFHVDWNSAGFQFPRNKVKNKAQSHNYFKEQRNHRKHFLKS